MSGNGHGNGSKIWNFSDRLTALYPRNAIVFNFRLFQACQNAHPFRWHTTELQRLKRPPAQILDFSTGY